MRISDLIKMGLKNLLRRKARTSLTVVGVVIGTISIIVMISIGMGMNKTYEETMKQWGSLTQITVQPGQMIYDDEGNFQDYRQRDLTEKDLSYFQQMEHVKSATAMLNKNVQFTCGKYILNTNVCVFDFSCWDMMEFPELAVGQTPSAENKDGVVFGPITLNDFYNPNSLNGYGVEVDITKEHVKMSIPNDGGGDGSDGGSTPKKTVLRPLENYGIFEQKEMSDTMYNVYMDIDTYKTLHADYMKTLSSDQRRQEAKEMKKLGAIILQVDDVDDVEKVGEQLKEEQYCFYGAGTELARMKENSNMMQLVLGCIGAVSMLVSAISIANTMIMSIYERTKEIGIMKVLGCYVRDIKKLFLFESAIIGMIGGLVGIVLSYLASWGINKYGGPIFQKIMPDAYMYTESASKSYSLIPIWLPIGALLFAMLIGVLSGYYPARRATKISAIEAMKTD